MIPRALSKYLWVALVATSASTAIFAHLYREALQDVARIEAEARADELEKANAAWAAQFELVRQAHEAREAELKRRLEQNDAAVTESLNREREATERLQAYIDSMEDTEWSRTPLPSDVVTRLEALGNE